MSDCYGHCIRIFSPDGILVLKIGREGTKEAGELYFPQGIAVDSKQRIIKGEWMGKKTTNSKPSKLQLIIFVYETTCVYILFVCVILFCLSIVLN